MRRHFSSWILCALVGAALSACGTAPASRYYLMEAAAGPELPVGTPVVQVARFTVEPPYDQDRIIYRVGAGDVQVRFYPYDRWAVPLDEMVANLVATSFDGVGGVHFTRGGRAVDGGLRLDGHLLRLEEVDMPAGPRIRYRLDLTLTTASGEVLHQVRLDNEGEAPADQVEGVVRWMQTVLVADLAQARPGLAGALAEALPSR